MSKALHRKDTYDTWGGRAHQPCHATNPTGRGRFGYKPPGMAQRSFRSSSHQAVSVSRPRREGAPSEAWADPARARWEQQRGKAEGAELSPGTPPELGRHSRKGKEIRCSLVSVHGIFRINSNLSPAPLPSARQRWERSAAHRKITCGWPWRAEGDGGTVLGSLRAAEAPGQGTRRVPGCCSDPAAPNSPGASRLPLPKSESGCEGE